MNQRRRARRGSRPKHEPSRMDRWRAQIDSFGGPLVVGSIAIAVVVVGALVFTSLPDNGPEPSTAALLGEEVPHAQASHVRGADELILPESVPPVGGPHFGHDLGGPLSASVYDEPVPEGNVIHSLEHGMVWISYNPDLVDAEVMRMLLDVADTHSRDVILSPRPTNEMAIAAVSWGQRQRWDTIVSTESASVASELTQFVETNRDRSPEPGIR